MKKRWMKGMRRVIALSLVATLSLTQSLPMTFAQKEGGETALDVSNMTQLSVGDIANLYQKVSYNRGSVHDPSIIVNGTGANKEYYVFGSHMGVAKTTDLMNWSDTSISNENVENAHFGVRDANGTVTKVSYADAFKENALTGSTTLYREDGSSYTVDFGTYDISEWISPNTIRGNMWAPDIIYNTYMGKWCMYLSLNGASWNSAVVLLTADDIEGPYVYEAPIVFTGFQSANDASTGGYTNTDLELVLGDLNQLPTRYDCAGWGDVWPHGIDPFVTYDSEGKLWLGYGSWSGGIYVLELDEKTGLRDYSVEYGYSVNGVVQNVSNSTTADANVTSDPYFGKKIAGGCYVSGEGPYVERIGDYYYLFMSYGFYSPTGGYNMRIFRSENVDGPYVDINGESAIYTDGWVDNFRYTSRGLQLMGNYKWNTMSVAEVAQGHNSAYVDDDGNAYVIYHTKFDDGTAGHQLRVHQLYMNEDGWIVAAPYEYAGETVNDENIANTSISSEKIVGEYDLIIHQYNNPTASDEGTVEANLDVVTPVDITLNDDGTITGTYTGTWVEKASTAYATLVIGGIEYKGVFTEQVIDGTNVKTVCFSAVSTANICVWGSKKLSDDVVVAYNAVNAKQVIPSKTGTSLTLNTDGDLGATITWESSNTAVLANDGFITRQAEDMVVTLTKYITKGDYCYVESYEITVIGTGTQSSSAYMNFDNVSTGEKLPAIPRIAKNTGVSVTFTSSGITSDWTPIFITDNAEYVYLSVLNYGNVNIFETAGTMSAAAVQTGLAAWQLLLDAGSQKVTISYNVDGSIEFYKNDTLMLTYSADTAIGNAKVSDLSRAMAQAFSQGGVNVRYDMTDVQIDYALDYEGTGVEENVGSITSKTTGVAYLDVASDVIVTFKIDSAFDDGNIIKVNGTEITTGSVIGKATVKSITKTEQQIVVNLTIDAISGSSEIVGVYMVDLVDSSGNELSSVTVTYNMDGLSQNSKYVEIVKKEANSYTSGYVSVEGTKLYFITIIESNKIHSDAVVANGTNYEWYNGIASEIYMTLNGKKYSVGSHVYQGQYANAVGWGTGTANGSFENDLILGESVQRGFMALGTFGDDSDTDVGCVLYTKVDLADIGYVENDMKDVMYTLSGYMGPNDFGTNGDGSRFAGVSENVTYVLSENNVYPCNVSYTEPSCTGDGYYTYTDIATGGNTFSKQVEVEGTATGHSFTVSHTNNTVNIDCSENDVNGSIVFELSDGSMDGYIPLIADGDTINLPTANEVSKDENVFLGWGTSEDSEVVYTDKISVTSLFEQTNQVTLYAVWGDPTGINMVGYTVSFEGKIGMNFYIQIPDDVLEDEEAYIEFTLPDNPSVTTKVMISDIKESTKLAYGKNCHIVQCSVAAKEMTSDINMRLYLGDGTISREYVYTVWEYANYIINNPQSYSEEAVNMVKAMLNYGGYAQTYFDYKTENLANKGVTLESMSSVTTATFGDAYDANVTGGVTGISYYGSSILLESETSIRHYFVLEDGYAIDDYMFAVVNGEVLQAQYSTKYNMYFVDINNIAAKDIDNMYQLSISDEYGTMVVEYGVYTNLKAIIGDDSYGEAAQNMMKALYCYNKACENYFESLTP